MFLIFFCLKSGATSPILKYVLWDYGAKKYSIPLTKSARWLNDDGVVRDLEFFFNDDLYFKFLAGFRLNQQNTKEGVYLGWILPSEDMIVFRNFTLQDEFVKLDRSGSVVGTFGLLQSMTTEYSYLSSFYDDTYSVITLGFSNVPIGIATSESPFNTKPSSLVDPSPQMIYLLWSFTADPLRSALQKNQKISQQRFASEVWYIKMDFGMGFMQTTLSKNQFNNQDETAVDRGLSQSLSQGLYAPMFMELGLHHSVWPSWGQVLGNIGIYGQTHDLITHILKLSTTSKNIYWSPEASIEYGLKGSLSIKF